MALTALEKTLLNALKGAHDACDHLLAALITADSGFRPSRSSIWPKLVESNRAMQEAEKQK